MIWNTKSYDFMPKKYLGQNFLIEMNIINKIIDYINPKWKDNIVEIGPGYAALTKPICKYVELLNVIELDKNLVFFLENSWFRKKLNIFQSNAVHFNYLDIYNNGNKNIRIFGNLPYNISVALILYLFNFLEIIEDMHFMVQKEVADRLSAIPGTKKYGRLSIIAQYYCDIFPLFSVDPISFKPMPKVKSMFVKFIPNVKFPVCPQKIEVLEMITKEVFKHKRKMLRHSLSKFLTMENFIELRINPMLRAENLTIFQYFKLVHYLTLK
ncbi:16S rRNA (adenine(1518)-N(6)/adenine(1519)-N(6))-dimethyltransferase RsmA [Buchnera aphidicola (Formosaphis micheliae)]|uniref:16S rRNA (adenine(1518)-N(6)/adenine(1519)-N(6))- dimethyltransferase RsmA n=1 Tax=Buchnera aphidicola TaxID=9 RepID=UPI0031B88C39